MSVEPEFKYDPVQAIRYHFTEFNIWVGIFLAINGGLFSAYFNDGIKNNTSIKIIVEKLGCGVSILFCIVGLIYFACMIWLSVLFNKHFKEHLKPFKGFSLPLAIAKIVTTAVGVTLSIIFIVTWNNICL